MHNARYYIFLDFPKGHFLRETKIPLRIDKKGLWNLDEGRSEKYFEKGI
jgi:hypothetical protein